MEQPGEQVIVVGIGTGFTTIGKGRYTINPKNKEDYQALLNDLKEAGTLPTRVIHLWGITAAAPGIEITNPGFASFDYIQELGFYSLLYFTQALARLRLSEQLQVVVVTNDMQEVTGSENLCPGNQPYSVL